MSRSAEPGEQDVEPVRYDSEAARHRLISNARPSPPADVAHAARWAALQDLHITVID